MNDGILNAIESPLVRIGSPEGSMIAAKMESRNPGGPAKDYPTLVMVETAEEVGDILPGDRLVEPMPRNTGVGLAVATAARGYGLTIVMSDPISPERCETVCAYGAIIELVDGDISAAEDRVDDLEAEEMYQPQQFENPVNPGAHYRTIAEEVLEQVGDHRIDTLVVGIDIGGTISGTGSCLVEESPSMRVVDVEPAESIVLSGHEVGNNSFQGIGPGSASPNLSTNLLDDVETVELADVRAECRRLAREEDILAGQPSGVSFLAARHIAERLAAPDANEEDQPLAVTAFWGSGERYIPTGVFNTEE